jgi:RNA polymerase subunit RPABC4/transcription elongation factor Spt4
MGNGACKKCGRWLNAPEMGNPCPDCGSMDRTVFGVDAAQATDREEVARALANKHYEIESGLSQIFWVSAPKEDESGKSAPIKLLEINQNTVSSGVMPLHFGASPARGIPYPSIIIEVTPSEFTKIQSSQLKLPSGWDEWIEIPKPPTGKGDS